MTTDQNLSAATVADDASDAVHNEVAAADTEVGGEAILASGDKAASAKGTPIGGTVAMMEAMRRNREAEAGERDDVADNAVEAATGTADSEAATGTDAPAVAEADNADTAAAAETEEAPGLVQVEHMGKRTADDAAARAAKLEAIKAKGEASELRDAKAAVAAAGNVSLTPAEERELRDYAEGEDDLRELREEKLAEKRKQAAMTQARRRVNAEVPSRTLVQRPTYGATRGKVYLHVRDTYAFLLGREANPETHKGYIAGMFAAGKMMRTLVQGHVAGCPYATWYLLQIEDSMAKIREMVREKETQAHALVEAVTPVRLEPFTSRSPAEVPLDFTSSYGFHFADLLGAVYNSLIAAARP